MPRTASWMAALALSFSLPLDAKADIGQFVQVFEVPPLPGTVKPRVRSDDEEEGDEEYSGDNNPALGTGVSRKPEDTKLDDGKPVAGAVDGRREPASALLSAHQAERALRGACAARHAGEERRQAGRRGTALLGADRRCRAGLLLRRPGHGAAGCAERRPADHDRERA